MADRRTARLALLCLAPALGAGYFAVSLGEWAFLRPVGDVLVALVAGVAVLAAGLNGYWKGPFALSVTLATLVVGGHLLGEFLRDTREYRLPPVQPEYYVLVAGLAVSVGLGAHFVGRWASSSAGEPPTPA